MPTLSQSYSILINPSQSTDNLITAGGAGIIPLTLRGSVGQTADLQEWQDTTGSILVKITSAGILSLGSLSDVADSINFNLSQTILQGII
jgi:hypothetical protein